MRVFFLLSYCGFSVWIVEVTNRVKKQNSIDSKFLVVN